MTALLGSAIFLDKDGTLVENVPYNVDPARVAFMPGALRALATLASLGFMLVVVTNQSGVARGRFTEAELLELRDALARRLEEEGGVELAGFQYCPHAADEQDQPTCACRKPKPGMLLKASQLHGIDVARSWMIGDTLDDVEAGWRAGCKPILFESGGETVWRDSPLRRPFARASDWGEVTRIILEQEIRRMGVTYAMPDVSSFGQGHP